MVIFVNPQIGWLHGTGCPRLSDTIWNSYKLDSIWPKHVNYDSNNKSNSLIFPTKKDHKKKIAFHWIMISQYILLW